MHHAGSSLDTQRRLPGALRWLAMAALAAGAGSAGAQPPPVTPGLWEVRLLRNVAGVPGRVQTYRVCLSAERALAPMTRGRLPARAETVEGRRSFAVSHAEPGAEVPGRRVEEAYRWLDARNFEGSQDTDGPRPEAMQYHARWLASDCGPERPRPMRANGEP